MVTATSILYKRKQAALINYTDFTELKEATDRLDELAALHSSILEAIPHAVIGLDNRRIVFASHAVETVFGWKPSELIGKTMRVLFHSDAEYDTEGIKFYSSLTEKHTHSLEFGYKRKDGTGVNCLTSVSRIGDTPVDRRIVASHTDITELKRAENSLKESQRMLSTLMGNLPGMAYRCKNDLKWTMEFISEGCYNLTGYRPEDLINNDIISYGDLIHSKDRQIVWDKIQQSLEDKEHFELIYRIKTASHSQRWVWERGMGIYSPQGETIALEGFIADITARVLAEKQLERSSKQLSIHADHLHTVLEGERTEIAREIHDELGQIMTALKIDLSWLAKRIPEELKETKAKADSMIDLVDSTIKTIQRISAQLRPTMLDDLGLTSAIEWLVEEFQNRTGIVCEAILDPKSEDIVNDEKISTAVYRICQEALANISRHSGANKAEIVLKFRNTFVELIVRDNGRGITKDQINQTDSFGILGIKERTSLLGGVVMIRGRKSKGTTIRVRIPSLLTSSDESDSNSDLFTKDF
ncbi:MAG: PAS domain S-box protein, partial [Deltaproteobacteria bacterium]|nr:PAS domain S-box protein [Deltaproteobacteria bacterium]